MDLIFRLQSNLILNTNVRSSFHPNHHHQIIHAKFNLKIFDLSPDTIKKNDLIPPSIFQFNWERALPNKGVNKQIPILHETIWNIMKNIIPYESKIFNERVLPSINNEMKTVIQR